MHYICLGHWAAGYICTVEIPIFIIIIITDGILVLLACLQLGERQPMRNWKTWLSLAIQPSSHKGCVTLPFNFPQWWDLSVLPLCTETQRHWFLASISVLCSTLLLHLCTLLFPFMQFLSVTDEAEICPQLGAAEIKVPSTENPELWKVSRLTAQSGSEYSLACFTCCSEILNFGVLTLQFIPQHLFPVIFQCWVVCVRQRGWDFCFCLMTCSRSLFDDLHFPPGMIWVVHSTAFIPSHLPVWSGV